MSTVIKTKKDVVDKVEKLFGEYPHGLGDMLSVLTHPEVLPLLKKYIEYIDSLDEALKRYNDSA